MERLWNIHNLHGFFMESLHYLYQFLALEPTGTSCSLWAGSSVLESLDSTARTFQNDRRAGSMHQQNFALELHLWGLLTVSIDGSNGSTEWLEPESSNFDGLLPCNMG